jgi:fatty-acyl-CoA synthase
VVPAVLVAVGMLGVKLGILPPALGHDRMTLDWAPKAAVLGVVTGVLGLFVAAFGGVPRFWKKALLAVAITIATLGLMAAANLLGGAPTG